MPQGSLRRCGALCEVLACESATSRLLYGLASYYTNPFNRCSFPSPRRAHVDSHILHSYAGVMGTVKDAMASSVWGFIRGFVWVVWHVGFYWQRVTYRSDPNTERTKADCKMSASGSGSRRRARSDYYSNNSGRQTSTKNGRPRRWSSTDCSRMICGAGKASTDASIGA